MSDRRGWGAAWVLACLLVAPPVAAQPEQPASPSKLPLRQATFSWTKETSDLTTSFSYRDVVDAEVRRKLQSGLPTTIVMGGFVLLDGSDKDPVHGSGVWQSCRIAFDVWNEVYLIQISTAKSDSRAVAVNLEGVLRRCADARNLAVSGQLNPGTTYYLAATVEVNPVSQEMLEQIRLWVTRPPGSTAATPGDSIFGSFVGLFVPRIGKADRSLSFRTQPFVIPM